MVNSKTPITDLLSVNIVTPAVSEQIAAPAVSATEQVASGKVVVVNADALKRLVDAGASVGDVLTLQNVDGTVGFEPGAIAAPGFSGTTTIVPPGSSTPTVLALAHNQNAYPKDIKVYYTLASGEKKLLHDLYSDGGQTYGWGVGRDNTGIDNTLNLFHVAIFRFGDNDTAVALPNPTTLTVDLFF